MSSVLAWRDLLHVEHLYGVTCSLRSTQHWTTCDPCAHLVQNLQIELEVDVC